MKLRLDFELWLRRHGWPALLALAAGVAMLMFALVPRWPAAAQATVAATDGSRQLEGRHRAFRGVLIPRAMLEARQRSVIDEAGRHGLTLGRIDYGFENDAPGRFGVATLQMPVRGNYTDFRTFLAAVLAIQPAVALGDLSIQRDPAGSGIEARLRLAFHTEMAPEARP